MVEKFSSLVSSSKKYAEKMGKAQKRGERLANFAELDARLIEARRCVESIIGYLNDEENKQSARLHEKLARARAAIPRLEDLVRKHRAGDPVSFRAVIDAYYGEPTPGCRCEFEFSTLVGSRETLERKISALKMVIKMREECILKYKSILEGKKEFEFRGGRAVKRRRR